MRLSGLEKQQFRSDEQFRLYVKLSERLAAVGMRHSTIVLRDLREALIGTPWLVRAASPSEAYTSDRRCFPSLCKV